jgi:hypothetical protein
VTALLEQRCRLCSHQHDPLILLNQGRSSLRLVLSKPFALAFQVQLLKLARCIGGKGGAGRSLQRLIVQQGKLGK